MEIKAHSDMKIKRLAQSGLIAGLYVLLTLVSFAFGLANGAVQVRISEALCILPVFTSAAVPGLFAGCFLANLLTGCSMVDVVAGSLTTLAAAYLTRVLAGKTGLLRKHEKKESPTAGMEENHTAQMIKVFFCTLPPVVLNAIVVPLLCKYVYGTNGALLFFVGTVALGELISASGLGMLLYRWVRKNTDRLGLK